MSVGAAITLLVAGCNDATNSANGAAAAAGATADPVAAYHPGLPGYKVSVFTHYAVGTLKFTNPDSIAIDGPSIYIGYQNVTAKDGSDNQTSTIVQYTMDGTVVKQFSVPGHNDGMRVDPATHLVWTTSNEDGNPALNVIDPNSGTVTPYRLPPTPHGGGYDDVLFLNGITFMVASNPTLDAGGNNVFPALVSVKLSGTQAVLTPVLMGNASATDTITNVPVTLNVTDPDSLSTDIKGRLVLVDQGGLELIFIANPGTAQQAVTRTAVGDQLDDTVWATTAHGRLLVTDAPSNAIYWVHVNPAAGTIFTEAPNDSGVASFLGTLDLTTGFIVPTMIGFGKPTGLAFVPDPGSR